jgi:branched-chain amino acid aminotransferase
VIETEVIWHNGEFVAWADAKVHVLTHGLHYGTGVFEGIRCYETEHGPAIFRHLDHLDRLERSAKLYYMELPYSIEQLRAATHELVLRNAVSSCYIRPIAFRGYGQMGLNPLDAPVEVSIALWPWGTYLGEEGTRNGIRAKVSSWERISPRSLIPAAKASGQYLNSVLAKIDTVRDGVIVTPPQTASILDGINRRSVVQIARDLGYAVIERDITRAELYLADEVFLTGTAAELVPVREVDDHAIGSGGPGEITRVLQDAFQEVLYGRNERYLEWLDVVATPQPPAAAGQAVPQRASA